tara:strand:- start:855 stop:2741 length:1887 start_codon:yes stop_codon:yes gene_type:complete
MAGLQNIRKSLDGIVVKMIVGVIIITFVGSIGWSVFFSSTDANIIAIVDNQEIDVNDLNYEIRAQNFYLQERYKDQDFDLDQETLQKISIESLIRKASILNFMRESSLLITDEVAYLELSKDDSFLEEGRFSLSKFEAIVRSQGFIPATYLKRVKEDIALNFWREGAGSSAFVMDSATQENLRLAEQTRDIDFIKLNLETVLSGISTTESGIKNFYDNNQELFFTEKLVDVKYINLSASSLQANIEIKEVDIKDEYNSYIENFDNAIRKTVSHLMINIDDDTNLEQAISVVNDISLQIKSGLNFIDLVKEYSEDEGTKDNGGELGTTDGSVFPPEFEQALEEMNEGDISNPIQLDESVHLLLLTKIQEPIPDNYEDKKETILSNLKADLSNDEFVNLLDQASDLTFSLNELESIGKELSLPIKFSKSFSRDDAPDDLNQTKILDLLFDNEDFRNNSSIEVLELEDGHAIILSLEEYQPEQIKSFDEVEKEVIDYYKVKLAKLEVNKFASDSIESLNRGLNLSAIAEDNDIELQSYKNLARNTSLFSNSVVFDIFNLARSDLATAFGSSNLENGDVIIYKLNAVNEQQSEISQEDLKYFKGFISEERKISELTELQLVSQDLAEIVRKY